MCFFCVSKIVNVAVAAWGYWWVYILLYKWFCLVTFHLTGALTPNSSPSSIYSPPIIHRHLSCLMKSGIYSWPHSGLLDLIMWPAHAKPRCLHWKHKHNLYGYAIVSNLTSCMQAFIEQYCLIGYSNKQMIQSSKLINEQWRPVNHSKIHQVNIFSPTFH